MAEINVTPFVDVMLVLLIIFMVSAPLMTTGVPIDLPETKAKPMQGDIEPVTVSVRSGGAVYVQDEEVEVERLVALLTAISENGTEARVYLRGDADADYGTMMQVMGRLNAAGFNKIGLVTKEAR